MIASWMLTAAVFSACAARTCPAARGRSDSGWRARAGDCSARASGDWRASSADHRPPLAVRPRRTAPSVCSASRAGALPRARSPDDAGRRAGHGALSMEPGPLVDHAPVASGAGRGLRRPRAQLRRQHRPLRQAADAHRASSVHDAPRSRAGRIQLPPRTEDSRHACAAPHPSCLPPHRLRWHRTGGRAHSGQRDRAVCREREWNGGYGHVQGAQVEHAGLYGRGATGAVVVALRPRPRR